MSISLPVILTCIALMLTFLGIMSTFVILILKGSFKVSNMLTALTENLGALVKQVETLTATVSDGFKRADERTTEARAEAEEKVVGAHRRIDGLADRLSLCERHIDATETRCDERHPKH